MDYRGVVAEAGFETPAVNVGEGVGVKPFVFGIVNFEMAVWGDTGGNMLGWKEGFTRNWGDVLQFWLYGTSF